MGSQAVEGIPQEMSRSDEMTPLGRVVRLPHIPARALAGLRDPVAVDGRIVGEMVIPAALRDPAGHLSPASLALLADGCLGLSVVDYLEHRSGMVTSHLHLEFPHSIPADLAAANGSATVRSITGSFGLADAEIRGATGDVLAYATLGAVLVPRPPGMSEAAETDMPAPSPASGYAHIDELFGTKVVRTSEAAGELQFHALPDFANSYHSVHGGMGALMGTRAMDLTILTGAQSAFRLTEMRAVFPRSLPASDCEIGCRVTVLHRGRRLALARAELIGPDQKVALVVDATYVPAV